MSDQALIAELNRQSEAAQRCFAYYDSLEGDDASCSRPIPDLSEIAAPITAILSAHPIFGKGRSAFFATKQLYLPPQFMSQGLLRLTLRNGAVSAVAWLRRLFEIDRVELRMVAAMHGIEVEQPVPLPNKVRFLPIQAAPDSPNLRALARRHRIAPWSMMDASSAIPPAVAILDLGMVTATLDSESGRSIYDAAYSALLDAARAFTLSGRAAPVLGNSWIDFVDPELADAEFGRMWMGARFEGSISTFPVKIDDSALIWAERYLKISEPLRPLLDVAIDRLNLARRRRSTGDQAIDSGICLEALLGDDSSQELTYKLRLRAALLLGKTLAERQEISESVASLYRLRSKVVHGRARRPQDHLQDAKCASRGLEICEQAVRAIILQGAKPDFSTWELLGGPSGVDGQLS